MKFTDPADILLLGLAERPIKGTILLIQPDTALAGDTLRAAGNSVLEWSWLWSERVADAWPSDVFVDAVLLHIPTNRELTTLALEVAASRLRPGAPLFVYGGNHEGIKSIEDHLAPWFEQSEVLLYKHRERVIYATRTSATEVPRRSLKEWEKHVEVSLAGHACHLVSYPGMFAHGSIDEGTALLLAHLPECAADARVLDMGSGTGVLARAMQERTPAISIDAVDLHAFAVEATKQNVPGARVFWGNNWNALPNDALYDLVLSNPPVHQGARQTTEPLEYFIAKAKTHLAPGGSIWIVVQGTIPVKKHFDRASLRSALIAENATYQVWQAR